MSPVPHTHQCSDFRCTNHVTCDNPDPACTNPSGLRCPECPGHNPTSTNLEPR